jgi:hypothetical protein
VSCTCRVPALKGPQQDYPDECRRLHAPLGRRSCADEGVSRQARTGNEIQIVAFAPTMMAGRMEQVVVVRVGPSEPPLSACGTFTLSQPSDPECGIGPAEPLREPDLPHSPHLFRT